MQLLDFFTTGFYLVSNIKYQIVCCHGQIPYVFDCYDASIILLDSNDLQK